MTHKQKTNRYPCDHEDIEEEYRHDNEWVDILKKVSEKRFCAKHHQHRSEQECLELIECMIQF